MNIKNKKVKIKIRKNPKSEIKNRKSHFCYYKIMCKTSNYIKKVNVKCYS